tara:strand:- start:1937 stop:5278 length:3342 start_codon:yes stop_codon:yes gene_type:complete
MSAFVDTTLIECNRLQSVEHLSNPSRDVNYGEWSNRIGDTLQLNEGDRVSISSAYINARGVGGANIETKGRRIGEKSFDYTKIISLKTDPTQDRIDNIVQRSIENSSQTIQLYDNEVNIPMKTYKCSNGENYTFLPRRFYGLDSSGLPNTKDNAASAAKVYTDWDDYTGGNGIYQGGISWDLTGQTSVEPTSTEYIAPNSNLNFVEKAADDYQVFTQNISVKAGHYNGWPTHMPSNVGVQPTPPEYDYEEWTKYYQYLKQKNGNERFTLFKQKDFHLDITTTEGAAWYSAIQTDWTAKSDRGFDPCTLTFIEQVDLINIKVDKGFHSPQSLATQITEQLQSSVGDQPKIATGFDNAQDWTPPTIVNPVPPPANSPLGTAYAFTPKTEYDKSITYETKTWKPISCASVGDINDYNYARMKTNASRNTQEALSWLNGMTENIYIKRPELWKAGRLVNDAWATSYDTRATIITNLEEITYDETKTGNNTQSFRMGLEYTKDNLDLLKALFDAQTLYPELWNESQDGDYELTYNWVDPTASDYGIETKTYDNSRFLHFNRWPTDDTNFKNFGDDGYEKYQYWNGVDWWLDRVYEPTDLSHSTVPLMFYYDKGNSSTYIENPVIPSLTDRDQKHWEGKLCYGFASKHMALDSHGNMKGFIEVHPQVLGGMNQYIFSYGSGAVAPPLAHKSFLPGNLAAGAHKVGYDWHFCAFGTLVMTGFSGYTRQSYGGYFAPGTLNAIPHEPNFYEKTPGTQTATTDNYNAEEINAMYIGAKNAALAYDPVSQRFSWEYLHTPEQIGNEWDAGSTKTDTSEGANPILTDAANEVYKINKRPHLNNFCPNMRPYSIASAHFLGTSSTTISTQLIPVNPNIEDWRVYDAHCGVFFDLGSSYTEEQWENGLLSILGFGYNQYNQPLSSTNNNQTRVDNKNNNRLHQATTNSQIVSVDTTNFMVNPYGAVMYSTQVPVSYLIATKTASGSDTQGPVVSHIPPISEQTQSIKLFADNLPRTMLRPYYCIRSNIVGQSKVIGGSQSGLKYPIVSIVNKINADKDFIQVSSGDISFTITAPIRISDITTSITDPSGELAELDEGSCVIYRIEKDKNTATFNIIDQILKEQKKG